MNDNNIIACICEGGAEHAIMDILLENNALIFSKDDLLDEKILSVRSPKEFERDYLRKSFNSKIIVYRILDSRTEEFELSKLYRDKVEIINVITAPEIEMLIIHNENKYDDYDRYNKSSMKPSDYCKQILRIKKVKNYQFVSSYFNDIEKLINAIKLYKKKAHIQKGEKCLYDLLKSDYQKS